MTTGLKIQKWGQNSLPQQAPQPPRWGQNSLSSGAKTHTHNQLIETCYALPWTPLALFVGFETDTDDNTTAVVLTIIAKDETTDHHNDIVTVVWRQDRNPGDQGHDAWQLTINGAVRRHPGSTHVRPSPPILAGIIRDAIYS